jgi:hypothetical protein
MTHQSLGVGGYGSLEPRACPWGSISPSPKVDFFEKPKVISLRGKKDAYDSKI